MHSEIDQEYDITNALGVVVAIGRVVTVPVVGGVVVVDVVLERPGSQMLNLQKYGLVIAGDSGPIHTNTHVSVIVSVKNAIHTTKLDSTCHS